MKCPYLIKHANFLCKAETPLYPPSSFQLQEYCKRKEHRKCPFFLETSDKHYAIGHFVTGR